MLGFISDVCMCAGRGFRFSRHTCCDLLVMSVCRKRKDDLDVNSSIKWNLQPTSCSGAAAAISPSRRTCHMLPLGLASPLYSVNVWGCQPPVGVSFILMPAHETCVREGYINVFTWKRRKERHRVLNSFYIQVILLFPPLIKGCFWQRLGQPLQLWVSFRFCFMYRRCPGRTLVLTCETTLLGPSLVQPCTPTATISWCPFLAPVHSALNAHTHSLRDQV